MPKDLQPILGKTRLKRSLGTSDLSVANRLKNTIIDQLQAELDQARGQVDQRYQSVMLEAARLRQVFLNSGLDGNDPDFRRAWGDRYEQLLGAPSNRIGMQHHRRLAAPLVAHEFGVALRIAGPRLGDAY